MWVFGYGSLLWTNWQAQLLVIRRVNAVLPGFRRAFNKASVRNWGTFEHPGPTLNLVADSSAECSGIALEFSDHERESVVAALTHREGKNFHLIELEVLLQTGNRVITLTPLYHGPNLLNDKSLVERVAMARIAQGTEGRCVDYVRRIDDELKKLSIFDPAVREFRQSLDET